MPKVPEWKRRSRCWDSDVSHVGILFLCYSRSCFSTDEALKKYTLIMIQSYNLDVLVYDDVPTSSLLYLHWWNKLGLLFDHLFHPVIFLLHNTWGKLFLCPNHKYRHSQAAEPHTPPGRPPGVDKEVRKALVCLLWTRRGISSSVVKTHRPVLHEFEAGAKVSQADVAVHIQQNVVGLNVPERKQRKKAMGGEEEKKKTNCESDSSG